MSVGRSVRRVTERKELEVMKLSKGGSRSQVGTVLKEGKAFGAKGKLPTVGKESQSSLTLQQGDLVPAA